MPTDRHKRYLPTTGTFSKAARAAIRKRFLKFGFRFGCPGIVAKTGCRFGPAQRMSLEIMAGDYVVLFDVLDVSRSWVLGDLESWGSGDEDAPSVLRAADARTVAIHLDEIEQALRETDPYFLLYEEAPPDGWDELRKSNTVPAFDFEGALDRDR